MRPVFISYRHEDERHKANVLGLARGLEARGFRVILDQLAQEAEFNGGGPDEGWPNWSRNQAAKLANRILIVGSAGWFEVFEGTASPGDGLGVASEAGIIGQRIYNQGNRAVDIRIVSFEVLNDVPLALQGYHRFVVPGDLPELVRWLSQGRVRALLATAASRTRISRRFWMLVALSGVAAVLLAAFLILRDQRARAACRERANDVVSVWTEGRVADGRAGLTKLKSQCANRSELLVAPVLAAAKATAYRGDRVAADSYVKEAKTLLAGEREPELKLVQGWVARWSGSFDEAFRCFSEVESAAAKDMVGSAPARLGKVDLAIERGASEGARKELEQIPEGSLCDEDTALLHFLRGKLAYQQSRDREALPDLKRAEELYKGLGLSLPRHWSILYGGATLSFSSDKVRARAAYEAVIHHAKAYGDKRLLAAALIFRADLGRSENRYAESEADIKDARIAADAVGDTLAIARAWRSTARLEDVRDNNDAAEKAATTTIEMFHRAGAPAFEAVALSVRGHLRAEQKRWDEAFADQRRALDVYTQLNDDNGRGLTYFEIGELQRARGQYVEAEQSFDEAKRSFRLENRSTNNYANVLRGMADLATDMAKPGDKVRLDLALAALHDARLIYEQSSSTLGLANVNLAEGEAWLKSPDPTRALAAFDQAIPLYLEAGKERIGRADAHWGRARALIALERAADARSACDEAVTILAGMPSQDDMSQRCREQVGSAKLASSRTKGRASKTKR